jgi:hypothetical protein
MWDIDILLGGFLCRCTPNNVKLNSTILYELGPLRMFKGLRMLGDGCRLGLDKADKATDKADEAGETGEADG